MVNNIDSIKEILKRNQYQVQLSFSHKKPKKVLLTTPVRKIEPQINVLKIEYDFTCSSETGIKYSSKDLTEFLACPEYCFKSFVQTDVNKICALIGYNPSMILFSIDDEVCNKEEDFYETSFNQNELEEENLEKSMLVSEIMSYIEEGGNELPEYITKNKHFLEVYEHINEFYLSGDGK